MKQTHTFGPVSDVTVTLKPSPHGIPFTFIHVPHSHCSPSERDVEKNAQVIAKMLRAAIAALRSPAKTLSAWEISGTTVRMPATRAEAEKLSMDLKSYGASACERNFAQSVVSASYE